MDFMSLLFIFVSVTLFLTTEVFWYIQKLYRIAVLFVALQLASIYIAMEYFHLNLRQLLLVMLSYFAIAVFSTFLHFRVRIKNASFVKV
jgi:type IV secretory pathway TrbL component